MAFRSFQGICETPDNKYFLNAKHISSMTSTDVYHDVHLMITFKYSQNCNPKAMLQETPPPPGGFLPKTGTKL
jgi:hypothetical protein